jgi:hypothetical protein
MRDTPAQFPFDAYTASYFTITEREIIDLGRARALRLS